ncbi:MAG: hypothetical protein SNJ75_04845 [Gemmataceae bacterium]
MMRRVLRASLAVLLLGGVVTSAWAQKPAGANGWWPAWGQTSAKPASEKSESKPKTKSDRAEELARLEAVLQRRLQVCDELRRVALEIGDEQLEEEAMLLDDLAWKQFEARSAKLLSLGGANLNDSPLAEDSVTQTRDLILKHAEKKRGSR